MLPEYRYQCVDRSVLMPILKRWVVEPVAHVTPLVLPANLITIGTNVFMLAGLILAADSGPGSRANFFLLPLFMFIYAVGDHLDGLQAKRTRTGSPLGEFCDHYLDAFNTGIVVYFALSIFHVEHSIFVPLVFLSVYATSAAVAYEEFRTGWLNFEQFGSLEGVALVMLLILSGAIPSVYAAITAPILPWDMTPMLAIITAACVGAVLTVVGSLKRGGPSGRFVLFLVLGGVLALYAHFRADSWKTFAIFCLYGAHYCGALMQAHLVTKREPWPDIVVPPVLAAALFLPGPEPTWVLFAVIAYLSARNAAVTVRTVYALRQFWYWKNPLAPGTEIR